MQGYKYLLSDIAWESLNSRGFQIWKGTTIDLNRLTAVGRKEPISFLQLV